MLLAPRLGAARRAAHAPGGGAGRPLLPRGPPPAPRRPSLQCHGRPRKLTPAEQDAADVAAAEAAAFEAEARGGGGEEGEEAEGGPQEDEEEEEELVRVYALRQLLAHALGPAGASAVVTCLGEADDLEVTSVVGRLEDVTDESLFVCCYVMRREDDGGGGDGGEGDEEAEAEADNAALVALLAEAARLGAWAMAATDAPGLAAACEEAGLTVALLPDAAAALAPLALAFYEDPSSPASPAAAPDSGVAPLRVAAILGSPRSVAGAAHLISAAVEAHSPGSGASIGPAGCEAGAGGAGGTKIGDDGRRWVAAEADPNEGRPCTMGRWLAPYAGRYPRPDRPPDAAGFQRLLAGCADAGATLAVVQASALSVHYGDLDSLHLAALVVCDGADGDAAERLLRRGAASSSAQQPGQPPPRGVEALALWAGHPQAARLAAAARDAGAEVVTFAGVGDESGVGFGGGGAAEAGGGAPSGAPPADVRPASVDLGLWDTLLSLSHPAERAAAGAPAGGAAAAAAGGDAADADTAAAAAGAAAEAAGAADEAAAPGGAFSLPPPPAPPPPPLELKSAAVGTAAVRDAAAALAACLALRLPASALRAGVEAAPPPPGDMQLIDRGQAFAVFVDAAADGAALERALVLARALGAANVLCVVGPKAGTSRAHRAALGAAAHAHSDAVFVTTDSPGEEDPYDALADVVAGFEADVYASKPVRAAAPRFPFLKDYLQFWPDDHLPGGERGHDDPWAAMQWQTLARRFVIADRFTALRAAVGMAGEGDAVVIAGRGDADCMVVEGRRWWFEDAGEAAAALEALRHPTRGRPATLDTTVLPYRGTEWEAEVNDFVGSAW